MSFLPPRTVIRRCRRCEGTGKDPKKRTRNCPICQGSGVEHFSDGELYDEWCGSKLQSHR